MSVPIAEIPLAHLAHPSDKLYVALFTNVQNGGFLREQLLAGNSDFEYAFINGDKVVSTTHLLAACFRAVNDLQNHRLRSRNVHSEIVFSLGTNNNIATSLKTFGVDAATKHLLAVKVGGMLSSDASNESDSIQQHLSTNISGTPLPFTDQALSSLTDWSKVRKTYKLTELDAKTGKASSEVTAEQMKEAELAIIGMIALRGS